MSRSVFDSTLSQHITMSDIDALNAVTKFPRGIPMIRCRPAPRIPSRSLRQDRPSPSRTEPAFAPRP